MLDHKFYIETKIEDEKSVIHPMAIAKEITTTFGLEITDRYYDKKRYNLYSHIKFVSQEELTYHTLKEIEEQCKKELLKYVEERIKVETQQVISIYGGK